MKKTLLTILFIFMLAGCAYAVDHVYLAKWEWCVDEWVSDGEEDLGTTIHDEYWCVPHKDLATGSIDLRSIPNMSAKGPTANGYGIFSYSEQINDQDLFYLGSDKSAQFTTKIKQGLETRLGVTVRSGSMIDVIKELLTEHGDPTGQNRWKPSMPGKREMKRKINLGTEGEIWKEREKFVMFQSKGWELVLSVEQEGYLEYVNNESHETAAQHLGWLEKKYGVHYSYFHHPDSYIALVALEPHTTYTEDWDGSDQSSAGCNPDEDLNWSCPSGKFWQNNNEAHCPDTGSDNLGRAEHDMDGDDNYAFVEVDYWKSSSDPCGALTRFSSSAVTAYGCSGEKGTTTTPFNVDKWVAGTRTQLASPTNGTDLVNGDVIRIDVDGDNIVCTYAGEVGHDITDTSITTGVRGGIIEWGGRYCEFDNFEMGDLASGAEQYSPGRAISKGIMRGVF